MAAFRRDHLGFVFQDFNLLDTFTLEDNIYLPLVLAGKKYPEMHRALLPLAGAEIWASKRLLKSALRRCPAGRSSVPPWPAP